MGGEEELGDAEEEAEGDGEATGRRKIEEKGNTGRNTNV